MSEPYYDDGMFDEESVWTDDDTDTLSEMETWHNEAQQAYNEAFDQRLAEFEAEQEQRYAAALAEEEQAELAEEAQQQVAHRIYNAAVDAGLDPGDSENMFLLYDIANGLSMQPEFQGEHRDGTEMMTAAFAEAAKLAAPAEGEDEVQAATRIMNRRSAQRQIDQHRARGGREPLVDERRFEAHATMLGSSPSERAEARRLFGMEEE